jgi:NAD(P)-dependent dehydrogenase (short-subunit alcohol dehydrogenase family)
MGVACSAPSVFITGAASGIGRACALRFARAGWRLGLADRDGEGLKAVVTELGLASIQPYVLDVSDGEAVRQALAGFCAERPLDVLVNNAGILSVGKFSALPLQRHQQIIDVNVKGVIHCAHAAFPYLRPARGVLINMSSASAIFGTPDFASYSASKFAVRGLTEALASEWRSEGVAVCDVLPPFVDTPMLAPHRGSSRLFASMGVRLRAQDVAEAVFRCTQRRRVHNPLTGPIRLFYSLASLTPAWLQQRLMRVLSGH